jgi:CRISPR-associated protein Csd2
MTEQATKVCCDPAKKHDFLLVFEVTDGNPNGDPDAGNLPRTDPETMEGLVTDVALKRKVRNFVEVAAEDQAEPGRFKIFVEHHGVLNDQIRRAYVEQGMDVGKRVDVTITDTKVLANLREIKEALPGAFRFDDVADDSDEQPRLSYSGEYSDTEFKSALDSLEDSLTKATKQVLNKLKKDSGKPDKNKENVEKARSWMCANFFDIRMFGAVMSTGLNAGQVRGPLQLTFSRSVDPIIPQDLAITRMAVTDEKDREKLQTIGRKTLIPYGLYVGRGFFSPHLAAQTGVTAEDLELFWDALIYMWDLDRSASRGTMSLRGLYVFTHEKKYGNAPVHELFERVRPSLKNGVTSPRRFSDYTVEVDETDMPEGVTLTRLLG